MKNSTTVGAAARELMLKKPESTDPIEIQREMHKDYESNVFECVERGKKDFAGDFFVVVITKKERLMSNVLRNYFTCRLSCPTPEWDQAIYHYHRKTDQLEFLWVIPSKDTCALLRRSMLHIAEEERDLLKFVLDYDDGTLMKLAKKLNGESESSIILA